MNDDFKNTCATVCVVPLVFIRKTHLAAIPAGLTFQRRNVGAGGGLFAGLLVANGILMGSSFVDRRLDWEGSFVLGVLMVVVAMFVQVLVYAGAAQQLVGRREP